MQESLLPPSISSVRGFVSFLRFVTSGYIVLALIGLAMLASEIPVCIELGFGVEDCTERSQHIFYLTSGAIASFFFVLFCFAVAYALELLADIGGVPRSQPTPTPTLRQRSDASPLLAAAERNAAWSEERASAESDGPEPTGA